MVLVAPWKQNKVSSFLYLSSIGYFSHQESKGMVSYRSLRLSTPLFCSFLWCKMFYYCTEETKIDYRNTRDVQNDHFVIYSSCGCHRFLVVDLFNFL